MPSAGSLMVESTEFKNVSTGLVCELCVLAFRSMGMRSWKLLNGDGSILVGVTLPGIGSVAIPFGKEFAEKFEKFSSVSELPAETKIGYAAVQEALSLWSNR